MRAHPLFLAGLFLSTLAMLVLEVLDTRLLSVVTWYHLSFFAVSMAMFGMAVGALRVYLGGALFEGEAARAALGRYATLFALSIPSLHAVILLIPIPSEFSFHHFAALCLLTVALGLPFYLAGVVVTVALTRIPGRIGLFYAVDLAGAALGAVLLIALLEWTDGPTVSILCAGMAALGAACFQRFAGRTGLVGLLLALGLFGAAAWNSGTDQGLSVWWTKGKHIRRAEIASEHWNVHAQLLVYEPRPGPVQLWGPGKDAGTLAERSKVRMLLDGDAGTTMHAWDGTPQDLSWVEHDVTSLPYHLRRGGKAAVIGVGGGRDLLTALWGESTSVVGVEINANLVALLEGEERAFAKIADAPGVELVHDEARSWFTRADRRFDVLQMSLVDTWAATGAGAFTLSENGLYTLESWRVFLDRLEPGGIFSISRWFDPADASETSRLVALGAAALLERGIAEPKRHLVLATRERIATLMLSNEPFSAQDQARLGQVSERHGFELLVAGERPVREPLLAAIVAVRTRAELDDAVRHPLFDYTPPTDERPYFFNMLRPAGVAQVMRDTGWRGALGMESATRSPGVITGNMAATRTLLALGMISFLGVLGVILLPLLRAGLPRTGGLGFVAGIGYFAAIGLGFMLTQVAFMQRFSVYLGHPTYAVVVTLFSMILLTGAGAFLSDRLPIERKPGLCVAFPLTIALTLLAVALLIQPVIEATIQGGLALRSLVVIALIAPPSLLLGLCFPLGLRLVQRLSHDAGAWMWGVNGAASVLGAVIAVGLSMWVGIQSSMLGSAALYCTLALTAPVLWRLGEARVRREHGTSEAKTAAPDLADLGAH